MGGTSGAGGSAGTMLRHALFPGAPASPRHHGRDPRPRRLHGECQRAHPGSCHFQHSLAGPCHLPGCSAVACHSLDCPAGVCHLPNCPADACQRPDCPAGACHPTDGFIITSHKWNNLRSWQDLKCDKSVCRNDVYECFVNGSFHLFYFLLLAIPLS